MANQLCRGTVHLRQRDGTLLMSRGAQLYRSGDQGASWQRYLTLPRSVEERLKGVSELSRRLFRQHMSHVAETEGGLVIIAGRRIFAYRIIDDRPTLAAITPLVGSRPLVLCDAGQWLYYGEYRDNPERSPVRIFGSDDGGVAWSAIHTFEAVRHIHGVFKDPYTGALWVTTGDDDAEAAIWVSDDNLGICRRVVSGSQQTRAIALLFREDAVYFGTDTPREQNFICRLDRASGSVTALQKVEGSVFHGCTTNQGMFFSTACEPSPANPARHVSVWGSRNGQVWHQLAVFPKDIWHLRLFQYGQIFFARGQESSDDLWGTPFAARPHLGSRLFDPVWS